MRRSTVVRFSVYVSFRIISTKLVEIIKYIYIKTFINDFRIEKLRYFGLPTSRYLYLLFLL